MTRSTRFGEIMQEPVHDQSKPSADLVSAAAFQGVEQAFNNARDQQAQDLKHKLAQARHEQAEKIIDGKITDLAWDEMISRARTAAGNGAKQYTLLRFPSDVCSDDARAINNPPNPQWPDTLRGEAADIYQRWHSALRPLGFDLSAQVLDFPDGKPGDVGLFLRWGDKP